MKKIIYLLSVFSLALVLGACSGEKVAKIPVSNAGADLGFIYDDLKTLEEHADYIIEAKYTGETVVTPFPESGDPDYVEYLSKIEVKKSFKGELKENEGIWISEAGAIVDGVYDTMAGYVHMNEDGDYLLFLRKFEMEVDGKTVYTIKGLHQGKFDLNIDEKVEHLKGVDDYNDIKDVEYFGDLPNEFNNIKEEVIEEYGDKVTE